MRERERDCEQEREREKRRREEGRERESEREIEREQKKGLTLGSYAESTFARRSVRSSSKLLDDGQPDDDGAAHIPGLDFLCAPLLSQFSTVVGVGEIRRESVLVLTHTHRQTDRQASLVFWRNRKVTNKC